MAWCASCAPGGSGIWIPQAFAVLAAYTLVSLVAYWVRIRASSSAAPLAVPSPYPEMPAGTMPQSLMRERWLLNVARNGDRLRGSGVLAAVATGGAEGAVSSAPSLFSGLEQRRMAAEIAKAVRTFQRHSPEQGRAGPA